VQKQKDALDDYVEFKVLIIDDENMILEMLRERLTRIGLVVDVAESAEEGIKKIHNIPYDLVFTDIQMPDMSGNDFFEYVKTTLDRPVPIIAMSGTPWLTEKSSFDAVIAKPFCKEELLKVLRLFVPIN
jgi:CheY-like chemotaxis protein